MKVAHFFLKEAKSFQRNLQLYIYIVSSNKEEVVWEKIRCCQLSRDKELVKMGKCSSWSNQDFRRSTAKHYSKKTEWIYDAEKDA